MLVDMPDHVLSSKMAPARSRSFKPMLAPVQRYHATYHALPETQLLESNHVEFGVKVGMHVETMMLEAMRGSSSDVRSMLEAICMLENNPSYCAVFPIMAVPLPRTDSSAQPRIPSTQQPEAFVSRMLQKNQDRKGAVGQENPQYCPRDSLRLCHTCVLKTCVLEGRFEGMVCIYA